MKTTVIRELRRALHQATAFAAGRAKTWRRPTTDTSAREERIGVLMDEAYYRRRYGKDLGELSPVQHYLRHGGAQALNPHPLFDSAFYLSQVSFALPPDVTLLEHYLDYGAAAGLSPSPLFDARAYNDLHADVAKAGVNALLHYIRWGAREGRKLPTAWPDLDVRLEQTLSHDPLHPVALQMLSQVRLEQGRIAEALNALKTLETVQEPNAGTLLLRGRAEQRLGRLRTAVDCYEKVSQLAPIHATPEFVSLVLVEEARLLEKEGQFGDAIESLKLAIGRGHPTANKLLRHVARLQFSQGERCASLGAMNALSGETSHYQDVELVTATQYFQCHDGSYVELLPKRPIAPINIQFLDPGTPLTSEPGLLEATPFYIASIDDAVAMSRCNVVLKDGFGIYDTAAHHLGTRAILGDSHLENPVILARHGKRALVEQPTETHRLGSGQMMFGVGTANYGHWFLEFLPRMLAFNSEHSAAETPIFIDHGMPPTHLQALELLNLRNRPVRTMPKSGKVLFERLYMAPVPAFFPLEMSDGPNYDTVWPQDIFRTLRTTILQKVTSPHFPTTAKRRLFIRRGSYGLRRLVNEEEIFAYLIDRGFEAIQPEKLTFSEQVAAFQSAEVVVGSCSSALTNAIFCEPGSHVLGLIHDQPDFNFRGYASFIKTGGSDILFVRGTSLPDPKVHHFHYSYEITIDQVRRGLEWAIKG